ncbi:MAG: DNA internalization-related competence protein ComEC/Rec2 [Thermoanaerobaculia bacterium]
MNDEAALNIPAAAPVLFLALGIAASGGLGLAGILGLTLCAALCAVPARLRRASLLFACFAAGALVESVRRDALEADLALIASLPPGGFALVTFPIERSWEMREESARIRARGFDLVLEGGTEPVETPLLLTLWGEPPSLEGSSVVRAEGFLRCGPEACWMSVKSSRLISAEGEAGPWNPGSWNRAALERLRRLGRASPLAARGASLAAALALGRGEDLDPEVREAYRRGGTYHLLVFSGMQIAFAAGLIAAIFRWLGRPRPADWILLAIALLAPPFAGHDPSVSRSATMIGVWAGSRILGRPTPVENLLFVSAAIRLLWSPGELTEPGFALTYGATGGLILIGRAFASRFESTIGRALAMSAGAELGTAPITALFFHQIVLGSSVVTVILSPLLTLMLALSAGVCAASAVAPDLSLIVLETIGRLDHLAVLFNELVADRVGIARPVAAPPAALVASAFLMSVVALIVRPRALGGFIAALCLMVVPVTAFATGHFRSRVPQFQMEVLDVGQGDAILIREGRTAILVDGGGRRGDPFFTRNVLLPLLADRGALRLDAIILTHPDPDHCAGLPPLIRTLDVGELWISAWHLRHPCGRELFEAAVRKRVPVLTAERIDTRSVGGIPLRLFQAEPPFRRSPWNNSSLVLAFTRQGRSFLLAGDIERTAELELLGDGVPLGAEVLKVAHHGSRTSGSLRFLDAVAPRIALISCGWNNPFGHPAPETLEELEGRGARIFRTDQDGTIRIRLEGEAILVEREIDTVRSSGTL